MQLCLVMSSGNSLHVGHWPLATFCIFSQLLQASQSAGELVSSLRFAKQHMHVIISLSLSLSLRELSLCHPAMMLI
jgi:hypothetical protein